MNLVRRLSSAIGLKGDDASTVLNELRSAGVPVTDSPCRICPEPCEEGHEDYGSRFMVDNLSEMRGSVKPYRRQIVISTGKHDWVKEVTEENHSLAHYIADAHHDLWKKKRHHHHNHHHENGSKPEGASVKSDEPSQVSSTSVASESESKKAQKHEVTGVYRFEEASRLSILNGSHRSYGDDETQHSVIVLPDYVVTVNVDRSADAAERFWYHALSPDIPRAGTERVDQTFKTYPLPYNCLILLCSHKRRDNRCAIAAPKLEHEFINAFHSEGWGVDTDIEDAVCHGGPLEEIDGTGEEREAEVLRRFKALSEAPTESESESSTSANAGPAKKKKALILMNSHIGGHKFAGNVIIYFPQGSSVWYGRVTTHEVLSIVRNTIIGGQVLPSLLRGGLDISRPGHNSLLDW